MYEKLTKMPEFYVIFARKIDDISVFYMIIARKIFCPDFFFGGGGLGNVPPTPTPVSYAYAIDQKFTATINPTRCSHNQTSCALRGV